mmetsp:Transcript_29751/g.88258  ORF Transcript_29751/g.88258 Transcript_29751/m.88258 type:complete len:209 (-) Transcript_29751:1154-1780(-)
MQQEGDDVVGRRHDRHTGAGGGTRRGPDLAGRRQCQHQQWRPRRTQRYRPSHLQQAQAASSTRPRHAHRIAHPEPRRRRRRYCIRGQDRQTPRLSHNGNHSLRLGGKGRVRSTYTSGQSHQMDDRDRSIGFAIEGRGQYDSPAIRHGDHVLLFTDGRRTTFQGGRSRWWYERVSRSECERVRMGGHQLRRIETVGGGGGGGRPRYRRH